MALTRERILDTAFRLLSQYGLADLSMRRLATELDVAPGALYYHVKNKQELLASLASRMVQPVSLTEASGQDGGQQVLAGFKQLYRILVGIKEAPEVVRLALALRAQALGADRLIFLDELESVLAQQVGAASAGLAAEALMHLALGVIEQQQTCALLTGTDLPLEPPPSYLRVLGALLAGFTISDA